MSNQVKTTELKPHQQVYLPPFYDDGELMEGEVRATFDGREGSFLYFTVFAEDRDNEQGGDDGLREVHVDTLPAELRVW